MTDDNIGSPTHKTTSGQMFVPIKSRFKMLQEADDKIKDFKAKEPQVKTHLKVSMSKELEDNTLASNVVVSKDN